MRLNELQSEFKAFLLGGERMQMDDQLAQGISPERLGIYQRNVLGSLIDTLVANFPATATITGEKTFRLLAAKYVKTYPPSRPALWSYGEELAGFLAAQDVEEASSMARLEWGLTTAYFAADVEPLAVERLGALAPESVPNIRLSFAPAVSIFRCPTGIVEAFRCWRDGEAVTEVSPSISDQFVAHHVITAREGHEVYHRDLRGWKGIFLARLFAGDTFGEAATWALRTDPNADIQGALGEALASQLVADFTIVNNRENCR